MKKLLLSTALVALAATPAMAQESPLNIDIGGYFNGYVAAVDQDEAAGREVNDFDILRNTELHLTGETTLDNGLTVGLHFETEADSSDGLEVEESYMYLSGAWGRVNFGAEDGAAYLLQVAAPSADANVDGIRQLIQPVNYDVATGGVFEVLNWGYDQAPTGYSDKLTYLTPVLNGFQAGVSYTPQTGTDVDSWLPVGSDALSNGVREDEIAGEFQDAYEVAVRYEGQFNELGFAVGSGYSHVNFEGNPAPVAQDPTDDLKMWNMGLDMDWGPFGLGVVYLEHNAADAVGLGDDETWVVGVDYTTGPFKLGASYFNNQLEFGANDIDSDRYTGGVVYTYGPGMTFRGSVSYIEHDLPAGILANGVTEVDATSVLVGTQVLF